MCPAIVNPSAVKSLLFSASFVLRTMSAAKNHHDLCAVHGQNIMIERAVRQWCSMFKDG